MLMSISDSDIVGLAGGRRKCLAPVWVNIDFLVDNMRTVDFFLKLLGACFLALLMAIAVLWLRDPKSLKEQLVLRLHFGLYDDFTFGNFENEKNTEEYSFSADWFASNSGVWQRVLANYADSPGISYLEVGVFEGNASTWMLKHVLTHPSATMVGIDLFEGDLEDRFWNNVGRTGAKQKVTALKGPSQELLRTLPPRSFDIIYIDGSHRAADVYQDIGQSWILLKTGGIMILDDYLWYAGQWPATIRPKLSIDAFLTAFGDELELLHSGAQVVVRKLSDPLYGKWDWDYSVVGPYFYRWKSRVLIDPRQADNLELASEEKELLERILLSRRLGKPGVVLSESLRSDPEVARLEAKLGVKF